MKNKYLSSMCFHLGQQLWGWEYYGRGRTVFLLGSGEKVGVSTPDKWMEDWFILLTFCFFCFQNFLIAKKKMVGNVSAPKIVENFVQCHHPQKPRAQERRIQQMKLHHWHNVAYPEREKQTRKNVFQLIS